MSRLSKLYQTMDNLRDLGLSINEDLIQEANELEEEIIKKEILPVLTKAIETALKPVKRELVLVVDYIPDKPLSVHLSRKRHFTEVLADAKEIVIDPEVEHNSHTVNSNGKIERAPASNMTVIFQDGTVIAESTAANTLLKVVKKIGVTRVRKVVEDYNLVFCKVPVISNRRDAKYGDRQKDLGDGWLLMTHSNNEMKKNFIEKVSSILGLGTKVIISR